MTDQPIILDTPAQIAGARLITIRSGISLEIRTGMKLTRGRPCSAIATEILKAEGIVAEGKRPNKTTVYRLFNDYLVSLGFENRPLR